jgi:UTP--glucose-1-phosphate uridylyltransferase
MAALYEQYNCSVVAIEEVPDDQVDRYGVIAGESLSDNVLQITDMVEKPPIDEAPSNLAIIGRYILTPDIFDILETLPPGRNGEVQITDALMQQAKQGRVLAYKFKGRRIDCGTVEGFVEATNYCFERSREEA